MGSGVRGLLLQDQRRDPILPSPIFKSENGRGTCNTLNKKYRKTGISQLKYIMPSLTAKSNSDIYVCPCSVQCGGGAVLDHFQQGLCLHLLRIHDLFHNCSTDLLLYTAANHIGGHACQGIFDRVYASNCHALINGSFSKNLNA